MEISVIIPTYNREFCVKRTLDSVQKQSHRPLHLIIVDNNSNDNTMSLLCQFKKENEKDDFKITILNEAKKGASAARNKGLEYARSEWVMFFDSDDTMESYHVAQFVKTINKADDKCDIVVARSDFNYQNGRTYIPPLRSGNMLRNQIYHSILSTQRYIVKREFIIEAGRWNEDLPSWNDWELGIRLLLRNPRVESIVENIPVHINIHDNSITGSDFSSRGVDLERAIDAAERDIIDSDNITQEEKDKLIILMEYKLIVLAALYTGEKNKRGKELYKQVMLSVRKKPHCSWLFPLVYYFVSFGGRGSAKIIDLLV